MEKINLWCKLVVSVSVMTAVFLLVIPDNNTKRHYNTFLTLILIFALIYPLSNTDDLILPVMNRKLTIHTDIYESRLNDLENANFINITETETEKYINNILSESEIECKCKVSCVYYDKSIHFKEINIDGHINAEEKRYLYNKISEIISEDLSINFNGEKYE